MKSVVVCLLMAAVLCSALDEETENRLKRQLGDASRLQELENILAHLNEDKNAAAALAKAAAGELPDNLFDQDRSKRETDSENDSDDEELENEERAKRQAVGDSKSPAALKSERKPGHKFDRKPEQKNPGNSGKEQKPGNRQKPAQKADKKSEGKRPARSPHFVHRRPQGIPRSGRSPQFVPKRPHNPHGNKNHPRPQPYTKKP